MPTLALERVVQHLRRVVRLHEVDDMSDGELLESFLADGADDAFDALVRRHGPIV